MVSCPTHEKLQNGVLFSWPIFHDEGATLVTTIKFPEKYPQNV